MKLIEGEGTSPGMQPYKHLHTQRLLHDIDRDIEVKPDGSGGVVVTVPAHSLASFEASIEGK